jgi:hypothetical protein
MVMKSLDVKRSVYWYIGILFFASWSIQIPAILLLGLSKVFAPRPSVAFRLDA